MRGTFQKWSGKRWVLSRKVGWLACGVALAVVLASFIVGASTTVWDNDEAHHMRMAKGFYMAGERVPCIQDVTTKDIPWDQFYYSDVLWPLLLSKVWLLTGRPRPPSIRRQP